MYKKDLHLPMISKEFILTATVVNPTGKHTIITFTGACDRWNMGATMGYNSLKHVLCVLKFASVNSIDCSNWKINIAYHHHDLPMFKALEVGECLFFGGYIEEDGWQAWQSSDILSMVMWTWESAYILYISRKKKIIIKNLSEKANRGKVKRVCIIVGRK